MLHASSEQVASIANGAPATVVAEIVNGNARFSGHVAGVLNQINPGSTDFQVKVLLSNPGQRLRPGWSSKERSHAAQVRGVRVPGDRLYRR